MAAKNFISRGGIKIKIYVIKEKRKNFRARISHRFRDFSTFFRNFQKFPNFSSTDRFFLIKEILCQNLDARNSSVVIDSTKQIVDPLLPGIPPSSLLVEFLKILSSSKNALISAPRRTRGLRPRGLRFREPYGFSR